MGDPAYTVTSWAGRCAVGTVSHRSFPGLPSKMGWPERLEPYQGGGDGPRDSSPITEVLGLQPGVVRRSSDNLWVAKNQLSVPD